MGGADDWLPLSGIQHFCFCRRQWALIHIERQWAENLRTVEGHLLHQRAHDEKLSERRGDLLIARSLRVISHRLCAQGVCDVVEFRRDPAGVPLAGIDGTWLPCPVEYKKGRPNAYGADELQLCAQAICLEEMLLCKIPEGSLFYGEPRRRTRVALDMALRGRVESMLAEMQALYERGHTPKATPSKGCSACSLKEICLPKLIKTPAASTYLQAHLSDAEESI